MQDARTNDFLKEEEEWQRQLRNAEGQVQRLCHCGKRAHFGLPNGDWVCREHSKTEARYGK